jgi:thymidylate synthase (FAD)
MISATLLRCMGDDLTVVNAARVSFNKNHEKLESKDPKLIKYLYISDDPEFYTPAQWRGKSKDKKQGSEGVVEGVDVQASREHAFIQYKHLLSIGVCEELARGELPLSTMTEWHWSGSLDAWADMCRLRCAPDSQLETQFVAQEISDDMRRHFPYSWEALLDPELMSGAL